MSDKFGIDASTLWSKTFEGWEDVTRILEKFVGTARPESVFPPPITTGDHTVITASEAYTVMGIGYGGGGGSGVNPAAQTQEATSATTEQPALNEGIGSGGGGGGLSFGRPVATIVINRDGVHVQPIVDVTKIGLAFFTMLGSVAFMVLRMRRRS